MQSPRGMASIKNSSESNINTPQIVNKFASKDLQGVPQQINMNNVDMMDISTDYHVSISTLYKISANAVILRKEH